MTNLSKNIGTAAESAVVKYLRANGWPTADRHPLKGSLDEGDVWLNPGEQLLIMAEVKGGNAAANASDALIASWWAETLVERENAKADIAFLIVKAKGKGQPGDWWAIDSFDGPGHGQHLLYRMRLKDYLQNDWIRP